MPTIQQLRAVNARPSDSAPSSNGAENKETANPRFTQYVSSDGKRFIPYKSVTTYEKLPAGCYRLSFNGQTGEYYANLMQIDSDELLDLPVKVMHDVLLDIKRFWKRKDKFKAYKMVHKRGILLHGPAGGGKCLSINTLILMADGTVKKVQNVEVGDQVMGPDSNPRNVLSLAHGREQMYDIIPVKGKTYGVNESHILSLKMSCAASGYKKGEIVNISVKDYLATSNNFKHYAKGYRVGVEFPEQAVELNPYFLGLWLGDGNSNLPAITTMDDEIKEFIKEFATAENLSTRTHNKIGNKASSLVLTQGRVKGGPLVSYNTNSVTAKLRHYDLLNNKHVPQAYKSNSRKVRLDVLAGLIDSDGSVHNGGYDFISKYETLANDVIFLARSLGYAAYMKPCKKSCLVNGEKFTGNYYRVGISGDVSEVPVLLVRKKCELRKQIKDVLVTGITVEPVGIDNYYGFETDGDHLFLLGDFTTTHNSSVTMLVKKNLVEVQDGVVFSISSSYELEIYTNFMKECFLDIEPHRPIVTIIEDIDGLVRQADSETLLLQVLDGARQMNNIVYLATTNYPENLAERILNRPSRFDRVYEVGYPDAAVRRYYFEKMINGEDLPDVNMERWVEASKGFTFAHMRDMIVSVLILGNDFDEAVGHLQGMKNLPTSAKTKSSGSMGFNKGASQQNEMGIFIPPADEELEDEELANIDLSRSLALPKKSRDFILDDSDWDETADWAVYDMKDISGVIDKVSRAEALSDHERSMHKIYENIPPMPGDNLNV